MVSIPKFQISSYFIRIFQASDEEGASKVYELLQGKMFRFIGWSTLFDCLTVYEDKFKQSLQTSGTMLPEFQEGDAQALVAYLDVLKRVRTCNLCACFEHCLLLDVYGTMTACC